MVMDGEDISSRDGQVSLLLANEVVEGPGEVTGHGDQVLTDATPVDM